MVGEQTKSLGEFLRQARQKHGVTLEQIASATKINIKTLHALESDQYQYLPAKPFIRGFIISYSRFIGLDPKAVLSEFSSYIEERQKERPNRDSGHSGYAFEKREGEQSRTILWIVMGGFIVLGSIMIFFLKPSLHKHHEKNLDKLRENHETSEIVSAAPSPSVLPLPTASPSAIAVADTPTQSSGPLYILAPKAKPSASPSPAPAPGAAVAKRKPDPLNNGSDLQIKAIKHKVIFKALENVLVKYQVDEKPMMKFVLKKDRILVLRAQSTIKFQASNSKSVILKYNNGREKLMNEDPQSVLRGRLMSLFYPPQLAETIGDPFPTNPAPAVSPSNPSPSASSTPTSTP